MKKNKWLISAGILWGLQIIFSIAAIVQLAILNALPMRYAWLIYIFLILICALSGFGMLFTQNRKQKEPIMIGKWKLPTVKMGKEPLYACRAFGMFLGILGVLIGFVVVFYIGKLNRTLINIANPNEQSNRISVYVLEGSEYEELKDLKNEKIGFCFAFDEEHIKMAEADLKDELGKDVDITYFATIVEMVDGLYEGEVDAIVLNEVYEGLLCEQDEYVNFTTETRKVHTFEYVEKFDDEIEEEEDNRPITERPFVVYISGNDGRTTNLSQSRSDVNILAVVNPQTKQVLLVNTPRDTYLALEGNKNMMDRLTHAGLYGQDCSMKSLSEFYDVDVDYYGQVNFNGFKKMVNAVGGVSVYSETSFTSKHGMNFSAGMNYLDGEQALEFVRERDAFPDGDFTRGRNQMKVIEAIIAKMSAGTLLANYTQILDSMEGTFATNVSTDEMSELARMQIDDMATWNVKMVSMAGEGTSKTTYTIPDKNQYVIIPDDDSVEEIKDLIQSVIDGETLKIETEE